MIISKVIYPRTIVAKIPFGINEILYVSALPTANIRRKVLYIVITGDTFTQYVYDSGWISGGATQIQSDWNQTTTTALDYIKNKPTISGTNTGDQDLSGLALKTNVLELDNTDSFTPSADYQPATKKYVDDNGGGGGGSGVGSKLYLFNNY